MSALLLGRPATADKARNPLVLPLKHHRHDAGHQKQRHGDIEQRGRGSDRADSRLSATPKPAQVVTEPAVTSPNTSQHDGRDPRPVAGPEIDGDGADRGDQALGIDPLKRRRLPEGEGPRRRRCRRRAPGGRWRPCRRARADRALPAILSASCSAGTRGEDKPEARRRKRTQHHEADRRRRPCAGWCGRNRNSRRRPPA